MTDEAIAVKLTDHDNRIKSLQKRMDKAEETYEVLNNMSQSIGELVIQMKYTDENVRDLKNTVSTMREEPIKNSKSIRNTVISCIVTGVVGAVVGAIMSFVLSGGLSS